MYRKRSGEAKNRQVDDEEARKGRGPDNRIAGNPGYPIIEKH
jgi:hypothetical protein